MMCLFTSKPLSVMIFVLIGGIIGTFFLDFSTKKEMNTFIPDDELVRNKDGEIYGRKIPDGMIYLLPDPSLFNKIKNRYAEVKKQPINKEGLIGATIGWVVCKILDSGVLLIRGRFKKRE